MSTASDHRGPPRSVWACCCSLPHLHVSPWASRPEPPRIATIEGQFGKAEVNVTAPSLMRLYLRGPDGLSEKSLLASTGLRAETKAVGQRRLHLRDRAGRAPLRKPAGQAGKG